MFFGVEEGNHIAANQNYCNKLENTLLFQGRFNIRSMRWNNVAKIA